MKPILHRSVSAFHHGRLPSTGVRPAVHHTVHHTMHHTVFPQAASRERRRVQHWCVNEHWRHLRRSCQICREVDQRGLFGKLAGGHLPITPYQLIFAKGEFASYFKSCVHSKPLESPRFRLPVLARRRSQGNRRRLHSGAPALRTRIVLLEPHSFMNKLKQALVNAKRLYRRSRFLCHPQQRQVKVFGIGLNKTGTSTLAVCLKELGYRHLGCRRDLLALYRSGRIDQVLREIDRHESFDDWPYPLMYRDLFERYGSRARFVLTTRSSAVVWLNSLKAHSLRTDPESHCRLLAYGYNYPHEDEQAHLDLYAAHNADVVKFFADKHASHQLLRVCWEDGDGWNELCAFLGVPTPRRPFPHANRRRPPAANVAAANLHRIGITRGP